MDITLAKCLPNPAKETDNWLIAYDSLFVVPCRITFGESAREQQKKEHRGQRVKPALILAISLSPPTLQEKSLSYI